jgi:hypothetical protein
MNDSDGPSGPEPAPMANRSTPSLSGSTAPKQSLQLTQRRGHAEATDTTIEILRETNSQLRHDHDLEMKRERDERAKEREELKQGYAAERKKYDEATSKCAEVSIQKERLETENAALTRDQTRSRFVEFVATIMLGVGGGVVSYSSDQKTKDWALYSILVGGGILAINLLSGLIVFLRSLLSPGRK